MAASHPLQTFDLAWQRWFVSKLSCLLLLAALVGCSSQPDDKKGAEMADQAGIPVSPIRYFPPTASQAKAFCFRSLWFSREAAVDGFENRWFSQHLTAAKEPSIYLAAQRAAPPPGLSTFRFTWLRSFHTPVFIRLHVTDDGKYHMVAKELSGAGGYQPGTLKRMIVRDLLPTEAQQFQQLIRKSDFFKLPPSDCSLGADGAEWVFEGIDQKGYHVLTRWSPKEGPARDVGEFLLRLSGWHFDEVY
jgi:hypothetical protein